jgi:hypothetical protein
MALLYNIWLDRNKFTYELDDHRVARVWADLMRNMVVTDLYKGADPWHGKSDDLSRRVDEFNFLVDAINTWAQEKILRFDVNNSVESLRRLQVSKDQYIYQQLSSDQSQQLRYFGYLINQIERALSMQTTGKESISIQVTPHYPTMIALENDDYKLFRKKFAFGDLLLHYPHMGKSPYELASKKENNCTAHQIVCQHAVSQGHVMRFSPSLMTDAEFAEFYTASGIEWPYQLNDPRLAVGYIRLGRLIEVNYGYAYNKIKTTGIVKASKQITNWQIFDQDQQAEDSDSTN